MLSWVSRKRLFDSRVSLVGEESLDDDIRKLYKYTGRGSTVWMDKVLLSPYASHKQFIDKWRNRIDQYSCCIICLMDMEKD
eukprot:scaffold31074_cov34-Attheya_sp.AAC.1